MKVNLKTLKNNIDMEWKIGEIKQVNGDWYQCIRSNTRCTNCGFNSNTGCMADTYLRYICSSGPVIFQKLEKVGDPLIKALLSNPSQYLLVQKYRVEVTPTIMPNELHFNALDNTIEIEVKSPIKEDMGKYRRHDVKKDIPEFDKVDDKCLFGKNLKPFNLEAAKAGKPVCTRDGRNARIICWDRKLFYRKVSYPILALVERSDGEDDVCGYNEKGKVLIEDGAEYKDDLMMLSEKKEGWVNIYRSQIYTTLEKAKKAYRIGGDDNYLETIKVEWEE